MRNDLLDTSRPRVYVGYSADETRASVTAEFSMRRWTPRADIHRICRMVLRSAYHRPTKLADDGRLWDEISNAPMSTDHALARFWVPWLCDYRGWALFTDGDVLLRRDLTELFDLRDDRYAVMCVQHPPLTTWGLKKDNALQVQYFRKNWSSVMLINCGHPANQALTLDFLNGETGRDLHAFCWLNDAQIGALPAEWNYLVGVSSKIDDPALVHFTLGTPDLPGYEHSEFADEWYATAQAAGYGIEQPARLELI